MSRTIDLGPVGGGASTTIDSTLSSTSTNPVQNKVLKAALDSKLESSDLAPYALTADTIPNTSYETWTFVDEDGKTLTKKVAVLP